MENQPKDYSKENTIEVQKHGKIVKYLKFCLACGSFFVTNRADKLTCDTSCKQRLTLRLKKGLPPLVDRTMRDKPTQELLQSFGFDNNQK